MSDTQRSRAEVTSGDDKSVGFEYQYYYFLLCLLNLKEGEAVGLEVKDDVHLEKSDGTLVLVQLKHSINPLKSNITERNLDFWKTLANWVKVIKDSVDGRSTKRSQEEYCRRTSFILITNKEIGSRNTLIGKIIDFQKSVTDFKVVQDFIFRLCEGTNDEEVKDYITEVLTLDDDVAVILFKKLIFEFGVDDLISKIRKTLKENFIKESRTLDVLTALDGNLRRENYIKIKNKEKITITFEEFHKKYSTCFELGRTEKLIIDRRVSGIKDPMNQPFIRQLLDIEDFQEDDLEAIIEYTKYKLRASNNLLRWYHSGDITELELDSFDENTILIWKNIHKRAHRKAAKLLRENGNDTESVFQDLVEMAHDCLDEVRVKELKIKEQPLETDISNGQFYRLSDINKIGWLFDWKERYNGK